ncbi:MAG: hypothetical protein MJB14_15550 [Spirochaetes bacterium]|nr:hypothetical protein [Spirochaetota bacterium]
MDDRVTKLAEYLHFEWRTLREKDDYHLPTKCPNFETDYDKDKETMDAGFIHCNKCDINMCDFADLEHYVKEQYIQKAEHMLKEMQQFGITISIPSE